MSVYALIFLVLLGIALLWSADVAAQQRQERLVRALQLSDVDNMDGLAFEHYVCRLMKDQGYCATVTRASGDLGVDIVATKCGCKYSVQVKRQTNNVSRRAVSDAVAGKAHYGCAGAMVITNRYFTKGAMDLAGSTCCQLVDRDTLAQWILAFQASRKLTPPPALPTTGTSTEMIARELQEPTHGEEIYGRTSRVSREPWPLELLHDEVPADIAATPVVAASRLARAKNEASELPTANAGGISRAILNTIRQRARADWPTDYVMQKYQQDEQIDAYTKLRSFANDSIPSDVMVDIMRKAENDWPDNFTMQLAVVEEQVEAYRALEAF
jgi:hypothetical protein